jgi:hypothetical protein
MMTVQGAIEEVGGAVTVDYQTPLVDNEHILCAYTGHLFFSRLTRIFFIYAWLGLGLHIDLIWYGLLPVLPCEIQ